MIELPDDQHIDSSLAQFNAPVVDQGFSFDQFISHDLFQPVPTTAHSTCSIFVPPAYEYFHLPPNRSQQPIHPGSPGPAQTARSTCSIFLPPAPSPPKSPTLTPVPEAPSVIVTPPSAQQSYILPVPASAKKGKGKKGPKSGSNSSSSSSSPSGDGTHIYNSSLPFRLSASSSSRSTNSRDNDNEENVSNNSTNPTTTINNNNPNPNPTITNTNYQSLLAEQELRIKRATEKGLAWLRAEFPADRPKPMPDPSLSRREVGRQMMRIIGRRTERIEAAKAVAAAAATTTVAVGSRAGGAGPAMATHRPNISPDPRGHMMSLITRLNRKSLQRAARDGRWGGGGSLLCG